MTGATWSDDIRLVEQRRVYDVWGPRRGFERLSFREASDIGARKYKGRRIGQWGRKMPKESPSGCRSEPTAQPTHWRTGEPGQ